MRNDGVQSVIYRGGGQDSDPWYVVIGTLEAHPFSSVTHWRSGSGRGQIMPLERKKKAREPLLKWRECLHAVSAAGGDF